MEGIGRLERRSSAALLDAVEDQLLRDNSSGCPEDGCDGRGFAFRGCIGLPQLAPEVVPPSLEVEAEAIDRLQAEDGHDRAPFVSLGTVDECRQRATPQEERLVLAYSAHLRSGTFGMDRGAAEGSRRRDRDRRRLISGGGEVPDRFAAALVAEVVDPPCEEPFECVSCPCRSRRAR